MSACLHINRGSHPAELTPDELIDVFAMLPEANMSFADWQERLGEDADKEPARPKTDLLTKLQTEGKHLFDQGIVKIGE